MRQFSMFALACCLIAGLAGSSIAQRASSGRPTLGITVEDADGGGVSVISVDSGKPASRAGIKAGDRITEFGGVKVQNGSTISGILRSLKAGSSADVVLVRGTKTIRTRVTFPGAEKRKWAGGMGAGPARGPGKGGSLAAVERELARALRQLEKGEVDAARASVKGALAKVRKLRKKARPAGPTANAGPGGFNLSKIQTRVQEMLSDGASPEEIEEAISEEFGGSVKIRIGGAPPEDIEEEIESKPAPKEKNVKPTAPKKGVTAPTTRPSAAPTTTRPSKVKKTEDHDLDKFLKDIKKKKAAKKAAQGDR